MINQMRAVIVLVDAPRCVGDPVNLTKQAAVFRKRAGPSFVNGRPALLVVPEPRATDRYIFSCPIRRPCTCWSGQELSVWRFISTTCRISRAVLCICDGRWWWVKVAFHILMKTRRLTQLQKIFQPDPACSSIRMGNVLGSHCLISRTWAFLFGIFADAFCVELILLSFCLTFDLNQRWLGLELR